MRSPLMPLTIRLFAEIPLLRLEFEQSPVDLSPLGVDATVLSASLQMLSDSFVLWHSDLTSERREEIVREVFGVAA